MLRRHGEKGEARPFVFQNLRLQKQLTSCESRSSVRARRFLWTESSSGEPPDATVVWSHGGPYCGSADACRIGRGGSKETGRRDERGGEVLDKCWINRLKWGTLGFSVSGGGRGPFLGRRSTRMERTIRGSKKILFGGGRVYNRSRQE